MTRLGAALVVTAVAALLVLPPLGQRTLATNDEVRFALLARDILERGQWFDVEFRGTRYQNKPLLYPWSIAALSRLGGRVTEATTQAPVAVAAVGSVLFTFLLGDRLFTRRAGLWAGLFLATSYGVFALSQSSLPDLLVVCFQMMAGYAFWRAVHEPPGRRALVGFYAALAFAVFAKGPVGLLPLLPITLWLWSEYGLRGVVPRLWSPVGAAVFALVTLVWLGPFLLHGSESFGRSVVWQDWLAWYMGVPPLRNLGNAVVDILVGLLPWTLVSPLAVYHAWRERRAPAVRFALLWAAVPLLVIVLAQNQRTRYLAPVYPGATLLIAWWASAHAADRTGTGRILGWTSLAGALTIIALLAAPAWLGPEQRPFAPEWSWQALPVVMAVGLLGIAFWLGLSAARPAVIVYGGVGAMVVILGYGVWLYTARFNELWDFPRLAAGIERHAAGGEAGMFGVRWFPLDFYLGRPVRWIGTVEEFNAFLQRGDHPVGLVNGRTWRSLHGRVPPNVGVLEEVTMGGQDAFLVARR
jgi:4-amino-4-deoxy-L-arabinose transferase